MNILSHRGFWLKAEEQNTLAAFKKSYDGGFGIETDIRDFKGDLVIAHNMPLKRDLSFDKFCKHYKKYGKNLPLALNVKADGLQEILKKYLEQYQISNYFIFDMSVPDGIKYLKDVYKNVFTRQSEYEEKPSFYQEALGVWIDGFISDWYSNELILSHLSSGKKVAIVSSELHKRDNYKSLWQRLKEFNKISNLYLCTDFPTKAKEFFYDN